MTTLDQLVEAGARALTTARGGQRATDHAWEFDTLNKREALQGSRAAILAILPLIADDLTGVIQRRMDERFAEYGTTESDTNASYYSGRAGELYESLDEEDEGITQAIRTRVAAIMEQQHED